VLGTNAIRSIGAVLTIVILSLATPMGVILAVVLLHESANIYVLISSSAAITSGVYYYAKGG
jgi:drug/metabolite transporter (DMT)-like permease